MYNMCNIDQLMYGTVFLAPFDRDGAGGTKGQTHRNTCNASHPQNSTLNNPLGERINTLSRFHSRLPAEKNMTFWWLATSLLIDLLPSVTFLDSFICHRKLGTSNCLRDFAPRWFNPANIFPSYGNFIPLIDELCKRSF